MFPRWAAVTYWLITLRSNESCWCFPSLYVALHSMILLWSSLTRGKLRRDVVLSWPSSIGVFSMTSCPGWFQVKTGGCVGQEWMTEQDNAMVCSSVKSESTDKDMGSRSSATSRKTLSQSDVLMADINTSEIQRLKTYRFLKWWLCS